MDVVKHKYTIYFHELNCYLHNDYSLNLYLNPDPSFELDTYFQTTKQLY